MFRKLSKEQAEAVAIFLIWIIAGMAFAILGPSLKHGLIQGSKWLAWLPLALAFAISLIILFRSKIGLSLLPIVIIGLVGGVWGGKGIVDLSATALVFTWKFFALGLTNLGVAVLCGVLARRFLQQLPQYLVYQRQMKELHERINEWQNRPEPEPEPVKLSPAAELALLVSLEHRLLNPAKTSVDDLKLPNELTVMKPLFFGVLCSMAIQVFFTSAPLLLRLVSAALFLGKIPWLERLQRRTTKRIEAASAEPDPEFERWKRDLVASLRSRRAELRCPPESVST